ncbi:hypothetical protein ID866_9173, partial [Astraeus odoratus]
DLAATLQRLREDPTTRNLDLSSYLLVPMQRLTRYPLLIKQILQYTDPPTPLRDSIESPSSPPPQLTLSFPSEHEERGSIANALSCAERILEEVNETIRERDSRARLGEVSKRLQAGKDPLDLTLPTHHLGPRRLIKEGVLAKAKSGRKLRVLLCSDILLLLNESAMSLYRVPLPVHELEIHFSHGLSCDDNTVRIHRTYLRWREALVLRAPSVLEARAWTEAIIQAAAKAKAGVMAAVGNHGFGIGMGHVASGGSRPSMDLVGDGSPGVNT